MNMMENTYTGENRYEDNGQIKLERTGMKMMEKSKLQRTGMKIMDQLYWREQA